MGESSASAWKCVVCGYIHREPEPPEWCPVCGVSSEDFEPEVEKPQPVTEVAAQRWRCIVCDYIAVGEEPPYECPVCGATGGPFEPLPDEEEEAQGAASVGKVVVVGAGIAGLSAAEAVRSASPDAEIVLLSKEAELPYYRLNLTRFLAGEIGEDALPIHPESWYEENGIRLARGVEVCGLSLDPQAAELRDGSSETFDKLVLTVGAHPFVPPFPGASREGVTCLRTVADAKEILEAARPGARAVCIGGGILGLETAGALARQKAEVTLLESYGWLLPRQLNRAAGEVLARHLVGQGVKVVHGAQTEEILGDEAVTEVRLQNGDRVPADLVVIATGVRPNSHLARSAGLDADKGILVNDQLATSHPGVYAAGDVAEHRGVLYGLWVPSQAQGKIAGLNAAGLEVEFGGIPRSNTVKVVGTGVFSIGQFEPEDASYEVIDEEGGEQYFRFVFRDGCLVGAILLGDTALSAAVTGVVESKRDFSALLHQRPSAGEVMEALRGP